MSISSSDAMALDKGGDLLDAIMYGTEDRRWVGAAIRDKYPLDQMDGHGRNAFTWAANKGWAPEMEAMIERGVSTDYADEDGRTPLIHAAINGHFDAVAILARQNVKLDARDKDGCSAAEYSLTKGFNDIAAFLISQGATPPAVDLDTELKQPVAVSRVLRLVKKPA